MTVRHVLGAAGALCIGASCAPARIGPPPASPPQAIRPADAIPADLDVAVRMDLNGARRALGTSAAEALEFRMIDEASDEAVADLIGNVIEHGDTLWLAFRPGLPAASTDNVLIVRGELGTLDPPLRDGRWEGPVDLGADWRRFERAPPERRASPARVYLHSEALAVFVSEAEIDSTERAVELALDDGALEPPARGLLSFAARVRPLLRQLSGRFPEVADALGSAGRAMGYAEVDSTGLSGAIEIDFADPVDAEQATRKAGVLLDQLALAPAPWGSLARSTERDTVGETMVLRIAVGGRTLAELLACINDGDCG